MASTALSSGRQPAGEGLPRLEAGDLLSQPTFHERYQAMPPGTRAELVEGVVVMPSPLSANHGRYHADVVTWLSTYRAATAGVDCVDNASVILGDDTEVQPDACLFLLPERGGRVREDERHFCVGPPELVVEVASSSEAYDLHAKRRAYETGGVVEYLVLILRDQRVVWFVRRQGRFTALEVPADGILRSECFAGLWLDTAAFFSRDTRRVLEVLQEGLAFAERGH